MARKPLPSWVWVLGSAAIGLLIGYALRRALEQTKLKGNKRPKTRRKAIEAIWESDDAVRANLPADMIPIFNKVKQRIKGKRTRDRTEAFLEWAEENPDEIAAMRSDAADREVERLVRDQEKEEREQYEREEAAVEAEERAAIAQAAAEEEELADLAERYAGEADPEEQREDDVLAAAEYAAWEAVAPPERADVDLSDAEFFRRLEVVPSGRPREKGPRKAPSGPVRALPPKRRESQSA